MAMTITQRPAANGDWISNKLPSTYKMTRKDYSFSTIANSGGFAQLQINGINVTYEFSLGDNIIISNSGGTAMITGAVTSASFSGGNTLVLTTITYTSAYSGWMNLITKRPNHFLLIEFYNPATNQRWTNTPQIRVSGSYDGLYQFDVENGLDNILSQEFSEVNFNLLFGIVSLEVDNNIAKAFYIRYQEAWSDFAFNGGELSYLSAVSDSSFVFNVIAGCKPLPITDNKMNTYAIAQANDFKTKWLSKITDGSSWVNYYHRFSIIIGAITENVNLVRRTTNKNGSTFTNIHQTFTVASHLNKVVNIVAHTSDFMKQEYWIGFSGSDVVITNGNFESGSLSPWVNQNAGVTWFYVASAIDSYASVEGSGEVSQELYNTFTALTLNGWFEVIIDVEVIDNPLNLNVNINEGSLLFSFNDLQYGRQTVKKIFKATGSGWDSISIQADMPSDSICNIYSVKIVRDVQFSEVLTFNIREKCDTAVILEGRNTLGGILRHLFDYSFEYWYEYANGRKAERKMLVSKGLNHQEFKALHDFMDGGDIYNTNLDLSSVVDRTKVKEDQQVYLIDEDGKRYGVIVAQSKNKAVRKRLQNYFTIEIEMPSEL
jgi:hypothetical protein